MIQMSVCSFLQCIRERPEQLYVCQQLYFQRQLLPHTQQEVVGFNLDQIQNSCFLGFMTMIDNCLS